jgi:hypothetical protein
MSQASKRIGALINPFLKPRYDALSPAGWRPFVICSPQYPERPIAAAES